MNQENRSGLSVGRIEQHGEGTGAISEDMDEQSLSEMQVTEGIREAEHERMLQSRRQSTETDEEQR